MDIPLNNNNTATLHHLQQKKIKKKLQNLITCTDEFVLFHKFNYNLNELPILMTFLISKTLKNHRRSININTVA